MTRDEAEDRAKELNAHAPSGWNYFAAHPEVEAWVVMVVRPPLGKIEEIER